MNDGIDNPDGWVWFEDNQDRKVVYDFCSYECYYAFTSNDCN